MRGDLCPSHVPRAARTRSRDIPCGAWPASIRHGGDGVSRQRARRSSLLCRRRSPDELGMGWVLASVTYTWLRGSRGLSCTRNPHIPGPLTGSPSSAEAGERGQRGREMHFTAAANRDWEQQGERLRAPLLCPPADHPTNAISTPGVPSKSPLVFQVPRRGVQGFPRPCHVLANWGERTTGLLAGKSCLKEKQSHHWTF